MQQFALMQCLDHRTTGDEGLCSSLLEHVINRLDGGCRLL